MEPSSSFSAYLNDDLDFESHLLKLNDSVPNSNTSPFTINDDHDDTKKRKPHLDYADSDAYEPTGFGQGALFMRNKRKKLIVSTPPSPSSIYDPITLILSMDWYRFKTKL